MRIHHGLGSILAMSLASLCASAKSNDANLTGLPTYPGLTGGTMDNVPRDLFGHQCTHFAANSNDALAKVTDWYRKNFADAKETAVNSDNMYGGYFKLDGIKLKKGNDFINVYRMQKQEDTSVEIFKCSN